MSEKVCKVCGELKELSEFYPCPICGVTPEREASWHVVHDHETGAVRGVLCIDCNHGIGKLGDSIEILERAIAYLRMPPAAKLG